MDDNNQYIKKILVIILLTNIPAILSLPWFFRNSFSWMIGTIGSAGNFLWLANNIKKQIGLMPTKSRVNAAKGSLIRYSVLIVFALLVVYLFKPNIIIFGFGLLSGQIVIYLVEFINHLKNNKYFRG
ncbi:MAG: ATP synthase subunit I [Candidatus Cloacimonetes bacterium]|nr:ATP synthase subunit I [Candidatus Cloacimonadota bacterium]